MAPQKYIEELKKMGLAKFKKVYNPPEGIVKVRPLVPLESPWDVPKFEGSFYLFCTALMQTGIIFPLRPLYATLLRHLGIAPVQLALNSNCMVNGIDELNRVLGFNLGVKEILACYSVSSLANGQEYYLKARSERRNLVLGLPDSNGKYVNNYVLVIALLVGPFDHLVAHSSQSVSIEASRINPKKGTELDGCNLIDLDVALNFWVPEGRVNHFRAADHLLGYKPAPGRDPIIRPEGRYEISLKAGKKKGVVPKPGKEKYSGVAKKAPIKKAPHRPTT